MCSRCRLMYAIALFAMCSPIRKGWGQATPPAAAEVVTGSAPKPTGAISSLVADHVHFAPAHVDWTPGLISVTAENASLAEVIREISRKTGMLVTGEVPDEAIYGTYGPASPDMVLTTLLRGTKCNMVLHVNGQRVPTELVLTVRNSAPTPPNPVLPVPKEDRDQRAAQERSTIADPPPRAAQAPPSPPPGQGPPAGNGTQSPSGGPGTSAGQQPADAPPPPPQ